MSDIYCACGAEWHGPWVRQAASVIAAHKERWGARKAGCGPITEAAWEQQFKRVRATRPKQPIQCPACGHQFERKTS